MATGSALMSCATEVPRYPRMSLFHEPAARDWVDGWRQMFDLVELAVPPDLPGFFLWAVADHLELRRGSDSGGVWVPVSEVMRRAAADSELLRACGVSRHTTLHVLDAMGGWGIDGVQLANAGSRVTLLEVHPAIHALQHDLLRRIGTASCTALYGDGFATLNAAAASMACAASIAAAGPQPDYDVVYLDPMFPERRKGALPARRMQYLAELTVDDPHPLAEWIERACGVARQRVVLKRRRTDPLVAAPDWQIRGSKVRYDVYRGRAHCS